jgi:formyl-CoA transferase
VEAGGCPELASDPRFLTNPQRVALRDTLVPLLADMVRKKTKAQWLELLETAGVPCGPINKLDEVFNDPQVRARECAIALDHPMGNKVKLVASPMRLSVTPVRYDAAPPTMGQHTEQILQEILGYSEEQLSQLRDKKII